MVAGKVEGKEGHKPRSSSRSTSSISHGVDDPGNSPAGAQSGRDDRETQTRDEEGAEERDLVLGEVGMGALGCENQSVTGIGC